MAQFTRELLPNNVPAGVAWQKITAALKAGNKSVEILSRVIDGEDKWELRYWDAMRADRSNSARSSPTTDY